METVIRIDEEALVWLNGWVGHFPWLDAVVKVAISDYLVPVFLALVLLGLWFAGRTESLRSRYQRAVLNAVAGLALANLLVELFNHFLFRPRPFADYDLSLLFYQPTDSSFPSNPAVVGFAVATSIWLWNRKVGTALLCVAALYSLSRVYGGVSYPLDVLGGAAIGIGFAAAVRLAMPLVEPLPTLVLRLARALYLG